MKMMMGFRSGLVLAAFASQAVQAQPVTEQIDRVELNWSTMRIRFYGEATADFAQKGFGDAERAATEEGLLYALGSIPRVRSEKGLKNSSDAKQDTIAHELTKQTYVVNTTYFSDGKVRVDLEGNLPKALELLEVTFKSDEPQASVSAGTSVLVQLPQTRAPLFLPVVTSPEGEILYAPSEVAQSAFKKNMTGRWFYDKSPELKSFSGALPLTLEAKAEAGKIVVDKEEWLKIKAEHPRLLEEAKVGFVLPAVAKATSKARL